MSNKDNNEVTIEDWFGSACFRYLGLIMGKEGGNEADVMYRIRLLWMKWRSASKLCVAWSYEAKWLVS